MERQGFPSINKEHITSYDFEGNSIFANTAVELPNYSQQQLTKDSKRVKARNKLNVSKNLPNSQTGHITNKRNNNFIQTSSEDMHRPDPIYEATSEQRMVPMGYFDRSPNTMSNLGDANTTSRHQQNKIINSVEFPQLNKTLRTETLYSLKSQQNASPHARIMQTLEKRKKK